MIERCDWLIGVARVIVVVLFEIAVRIPVGVVVVAARIELNKSHAALDQPPRKQATPAEIGRARVVETVELVHFSRFVVEVYRARRMLLHLVRQLVAGDTRRQIAVVDSRGSVLGV